jgi:hypothetical protein
MVLACEQKTPSTASPEQLSTSSPQPNPAAAASFDFQERCAKQAREQFQQSYWSKQEMTGFTNHYNEKLNRCFMLVESTDVKTDPGTMWINKTLLDAFEGRELATYSWHSDKVKKYWQVPPFQCEVTLPSGEKKICNSDAEFEELIKVYME